MAIKRIGQKKNETNYVRLALLIGGGYLVYKLAKKMGGWIDDPTGVDAENENYQDKLVVDEAKLTYPIFNYTSWANAIETALLIDLTEDEAAVDGIVYQMQNDDDWKQLNKAFGVRIDYTLGYIPSYSYTLPSAIRILMPERVDPYNSHFSGWNMKSRI